MKINTITSRYSLTHERISLFSLKFVWGWFPGKWEDKNIDSLLKKRNEPQKHVVLNRVGNRRGRKEISLFVKLDQ